ncbi:hypothetical protein HY251_14205, partial [bacterium]|nr:hypothetical protein [bacterium]
NRGKCLLKQADRASGEKKRSLARQAAVALEKSGATEPDHQLFATVAADLSTAYRIQKRHALELLYLDVLYVRAEDAGRELVLPRLVEAAMDAAWEAGELPSRIAELEKSLAETKDEARQKPLKDDLAVAKDEKTVLGAVTERLSVAVKRFEDIAKARIEAKERGAGPLLRAAAWIAYFVHGDTARALKDWDGAIEATLNAVEKSRIEQERRCAARGEKSLAAWGVGEDGPSAAPSKDRSVGPR